MNVKSTKKEIIILRHNGGQLGNQLLLFTSIYAYCLEKGYKCTNYSFYEYNKYFNFQTPNFWVWIFEKLSEIRFYRRRVIVYLIYKYISYLLQILQKGAVIKEDPKDFFYLPPTWINNPKHKAIIKGVEDSSDKIIYIDGWTFRNPLGLKKYRNQIIQVFNPKKEIIQKANQFINQIKKDNFLVGVHIRQGEYKNKKFMDARLYFKEDEVADILRNYLKKANKNPQKVLFILYSDEPLNLSPFSGLKIQIGIGSMMEDLITLSMCNLIIGSNSTFGSFAAFFGNIQFFIFDREKKWVKAKGNNLMQGIL